MIEHATIKGDYVKYIGERFLTHFEVYDIQMHSFPNTTDFIIIKFTLKRRYGYYMAMVYLPSACLILAAEITLFVDESHFAATTMVSLISSIIVFTMWKTGSSALPQTSYMKMIDVWLLPGQLLPFIVFLIEVLARIYFCPIQLIDGLFRSLYLINKLFDYRYLLS